MKPTINNQGKQKNSLQPSSQPSAPTNKKKMFNLDSSPLKLLGLISAIVGLFGFFGLTFYSCMPSPVPPKYTILVPLAATGSEYNAFMENPNGIYEEKYNNKASQNIRDIVKVAKTQWTVDAKNKKLVIPDVDFFYFPEGDSDNPNSFENAFNKAKQIAEKNNREVIGLLGNISSTSTLKYGEYCAKYKIPMILPLATATGLMKALELKGVPAVLRLPPANDKQAASISNFLLMNNVSKTVVIKDLSNETYSNDLVEGFRENYVQIPLGQRKKPFGEILATVPAGGKETSPFLSSVLSNQENGLLIVGMTNSAIEAYAQTKSLKANYKMIVLTDGAVDEYLGERIMNIQSNENPDNLYLSFPLPCSLNKSLELYINNNVELAKSKFDFEMTHSLFVADGVYIMMSVISQEIDGGLKHKGVDILTNYINSLRKTAREEENIKIQNRRNETQILSPTGVNILLELPFSNVDERKYIIDKNGNNIGGDYYLYKMNKNGGAEISWSSVSGINPAQSNTPVNTNQSNASIDQSNVLTNVNQSNKNTNSNQSQIKTEIKPNCVSGT